MSDYIAVVKRDGREVPFDRTRISSAIFKAANEVEPLDPAVTAELADDISDKLFHEGKEKFAVEEIQDIVVDTLTHTYPKIATAYAIYRQKRTDVRELKSVENKIISDVIFTDAKDNDDARENANVNADAPAGGMLKIGAGVSKEFNLRSIVRPEHAQMHREGKIHIHDLDWFSLCWNCISLPLGKLLERGFSNGHGALRTPANIRTAATQMCIIIQANQNQMFFRLD